ncbi:MAG: hypothetical protein CMJ65_06870, partial [Planctomycetaceae bacterium]|nr:hypothetical protein [Planctomycetaceae bacterium]
PLVNTPAAIPTTTPAVGLLVASPLVNTPAAIPTTTPAVGLLAATRFLMAPPKEVPVLMIQSHPEARNPVVGTISRCRMILVTTMGFPAMKTLMTTFRKTVRGRRMSPTAPTMISLARMTCPTWETAMMNRLPRKMNPVRFHPIPLPGMKRHQAMMEPKHGRERLLLRTFRPFPGDFT